MAATARSNWIEWTVFDVRSKMPTPVTCRTTLIARWEFARTVASLFQNQPPGVDSCVPVRTFLSPRKVALGSLIGWSGND